MAKSTPILAILAAAAAMLIAAGTAEAYQVQPGDTLWSIAHRAGVPVDQLAAENGISDPNHIEVGQTIQLTPPAPAAAAAPATYTVRHGDTLWSIAMRTGTDPATLAALNGVTDPQRLRTGTLLKLVAPAPATPAGKPGTPTTRAAGRSTALALLSAAAKQFGVDPSLTRALALWESGLDQAEVSVDGAVGLMQVLPVTAAWAGPALLGRQVDLTSAADNVQLGTALMARYVAEFHDPRLALAAYYQGETGTRQHGIYPSSLQYVNGIWALRGRLAGAA